MGWFNLANNSVAGNGSRARHITRNLLATRRLIEFCIQTLLCKLLQRHGIFQKIQFSRQQIAYVRALAELKYQSPISINTLVMKFHSEFQ
jgi:hypothetical protein